jgi:type I restriction enzyme, S subunit
MTTRLRHVVKVNPLSRRFDRLGDDELVTFLPMENVWTGDQLDLSQSRPKSAVATGYTRFESGDVVVPKITPTFEASRSVLIPDIPHSVGAGTTELHVVRPGPEIDPRYLLYIFHGHDFLKLGAAEMYGVAGQKRVPDDLIRDWTVDLPPLDEQRRIADFLDAETAKMDQMISLRTRQASLLDEREASWRSRLFLKSKSGTWVRVKHLLSSKPRYGVLVPEFVDDGIPLIRVGDLTGLSSRDGLVMIPEHLSAKYQRTVTRLGDVLVAVVGATIGKVAVVSEDVTGANTNRAIAVLRLHPKHMPSLFATWVGGTEFKQQALFATSADSAQPTLGMEDLANFSLRWPMDDIEEKAMANIVAEHQRATVATHTGINRQLALLAERRQALITATVTGAISV